jgi:hypothetical protein
MTPEKFQIKINSILGGESPLSYFSGADQFYASINIDPASGFNMSGLLAPLNPVKVSDETLTAAPMWIKRNPKDFYYYVYGSNGSVYAYMYNGSFIGLTDLNDGGKSEGNGCAYYDNYMYFARSTTIARYGPLNGTPAFTDDFWVGVLGKTALTDTQYLSDSWTTLLYPNHVLHRHSDGRLYIADMVDNKGTIHFIQTSKTTVEGDTDNGSTFGKVQVGYGLLPMAMESYGSDLVIAFCEGGLDVGDAGTPSRQMNAKLAFWDTTSNNVNAITWSEYPDPIITALKNINGVLYVFSGSVGVHGCRVTRYVGGYTFEEVGFFERDEIQPPYPGAVDGTGNRLLFGTRSNNVKADGSKLADGCGAVVSLGLQKSGLSQGIFRVMGSTGSTAAVTSLTLLGTYFGYDYPLVGWSSGSLGGGDNGLDKLGGNNDYSKCQTVWQSQLYKVGNHFKIIKIRIPFAQKLASGMSVTPRIIIDCNASEASSTDIHELTTINSTSFPNDYVATIRPDGLTGKHSLQLELEWTGTKECIVSLPIVIEIETISE